LGQQIGRIQLFGQGLRILGLAVGGLVLAALALKVGKL